MIKDVITENSETRKMIDDREKADKVRKRSVRLFCFRFYSCHQRS